MRHPRSCCLQEAGDLSPSSGRYASVEHIYTFDYTQTATSSLVRVHEPKTNHRSTSRSARAQELAKRSHYVSARNISFRSTGDLTPACTVYLLLLDIRSLIDQVLRGVLFSGLGLYLLYAAQGHQVYGHHPARETTGSIRCGDAMRVDKLQPRAKGSSSESFECSLLVLSLIHI